MTANCQINAGLIIKSTEKDKKRKKFWSDFFKRHVQMTSLEGLEDDLSKTNTKKSVSPRKVPGRNSGNLSKLTKAVNKSTFGRTLVKNRKYRSTTPKASKKNLSEDKTLIKSNNTKTPTKQTRNSKTVCLNITKTNIDDKENRLEYLFRQRYQSIASHNVSSFKFWDHAVYKELQKVNEKLSWPKVKILVLQIAKKITDETIN